MVLAPLLVTRFVGKGKAALAADQRDKAVSGFQLTQALDLGGVFMARKPGTSDDFASPNETAARNCRAKAADSRQRVPLLP